MFFLLSDLSNSNSTQRSSEGKQSQYESQVRNMSADVWFLHGVADIRAADWEAPL